MCGRYPPRRSSRLCSRIRSERTWAAPINPHRPGSVLSRTAALKLFEALGGSGATIRTVVPAAENVRRPTTGLLAIHALGRVACATTSDGEARSRSAFALSIPIRASPCLTSA